MSLRYTKNSSNGRRSALWRLCHPPEIQHSHTSPASNFYCLVSGQLLSDTHILPVRILPRHLDLGISVVDVNVPLHRKWRTWKAVSTSVILCCVFAAVEVSMILGVKVRKLES